MRLLALLVLGLAITSSALADPLGDAKAAYQRGDYAAALRLWRELADAGDANAQFWMGAAYDLGRGVATDYAAASISESCSPPAVAFTATMCRPTSGSRWRAPRRTATSSRRE